MGFGLEASGHLLPNSCSVSLSRTLPTIPPDRPGRGVRNTFPARFRDHSPRWGIHPQLLRLVAQCICEQPWSLSYRRSGGRRVHILGQSPESEDCRPHAPHMGRTGRHRSSAAGLVDPLASQQLRLPHSDETREMAVHACHVGRSASLRCGNACKPPRFQRCRCCRSLLQ